MALGAYGIKRPADVLPNDMEVIVHAAPNRDATSKPHYLNYKQIQY
eukprot:SAG11_NODE_699_length_7677_cov_4.730800_3_plen_46_part_00